MFDRSLLGTWGIPINYWITLESELRPFLDEIGCCCDWINFCLSNNINDGIAIDCNSYTTSLSGTRWKRGESLNSLHDQFEDDSPHQPLKPIQDSLPIIPTHHSEAQVV